MLLAAFLDFQGEQAVLVGGGQVARRRAGVLLAAGLQLTVVAPVIHPELKAGPVRCTEREYQSGDLHGARVVLACTDNRAVNDRVTADARRLGVLVNHAGDAAQGNFRFPATVQRGALQVALNTGGELPMLAQALTERLGQVLPDALPLDAWVRQREQAISLPEQERQQALDVLRHDIRRHVGLGA